MSDFDEYPRLLWPMPDDPSDLSSYYDMEYRNYIRALVEIPGGRQYSVYFTTPLRLTQDLETEMELGGSIYWFEKNTVVIPEVTPDYIQQTLLRLWKGSEFDRMIPEHP